MNEGWVWNRCGASNKGRWFVRNERSEACALSIIRRKDGWYILGDDKDRSTYELRYCPVLGGPMPLRVAKVAYLMHIKNEDFNW